ncbi:hypothetical protein GCM10010919_16630 [Alishewanella longhuensis]|uniref:diguanylate cyclase n=1 Tax=Alishewanella longhuensis TaxID=1091037 RepID=A0ABQ3L048_9ALTE|nr:tetratricopeptide repeat-containing diguanylate cyclase [Alishewanella longhuensis]GHG67712.1 hypothetical protein GCM10010919_16630 [Alishewanella longhuensis]
MQTSAIRLLFCCISLLYFQVGQLKANEQLPINNTAITTTQQVDSALEQQLDAMLALQLTDPVEANNQLTAIIAAMNERTPLDTKVRALTYQLFNALYASDTAATEESLALLQQFKQSELSLSALVEIQAAALEVDIFQNRLNEAYLKAEQIQNLMTDISNPRIRYWVNTLLARLFLLDTQYDKALKHYDLALDALFDTADSRTLVRRIYLSQQSALVHAEQKNWQAARQVLEDAYAEIKHHKRDELLPDVYLTLGFVLVGQKDFAAAEEINQRGLALAKELNQQSLAITFMNNLGSVYIQQENSTAANAILEQALAEAEQLNDEENVQVIKFNLGYTQIMAGNHQVGLQQMQQAFAYYQQRNYKAEIEDLLSWFAKAYKLMGDYKMLAATLEQQMQLREEMVTAEREQNTRDLQARYDLKSQSQQITILQQENSLQEELIKNKKLQQTITLMFVVIMLFAAILLINLYRKVRRTNKRLKEVNKQLEFQSLRDPLTGLLNRRAMQEKMAKRHISGDAAPCALLILDIDYFKQINDNYGHAAGDAVLIEISRRLSQLVKDSEMLIRWGGEEFLMVLNSTTATQIDLLSQQLLKVISELTINYEGKEIAVTISGGFINLPFAQVPEHQLNWEKVLQIADMALYLSKVNGRNQITLIDGLKVPFAVAEPHLQSDLNGAIRENQVSYHIISG